MFKVDIKYCPWAFAGDYEHSHYLDVDPWEVLKKDIVSESEALTFANEVQADAWNYKHCVIRITNENCALYETTIRS